MEGGKWPVVLACLSKVIGSFASYRTYCAENMFVSDTLVPNMI